MGAMIAFVEGLSVSVMAEESEDELVNEEDKIVGRIDSTEFVGDGGRSMS